MNVPLPSVATVLLVAGVLSVTVGVALFDRRVGLIVFGGLCFAGLYLHRRSVYPS